jgi:hypothetical protein
MPFGKQFMSGGGGIGIVIGLQITRMHRHGVDLIERVAQKPQYFCAPGTQGLSYLMTFANRPDIDNRGPRFEPLEVIPPGFGT